MVLLLSRLLSSILVVDLLIFASNAETGGGKEVCDDATSKEYALARLVDEFPPIDRWPVD